MSFLEKMRGLAGLVCDRKNSVSGESQTKQSLIVPFIRELGYDVDDPAEVDLEFRADVGVKGGERVDYAIKRDENPIILVECKRRGHSFQDADLTQLYRYFNATDAQIGIWTNGVQYKFFTDEEKPNIMYTDSFFDFNVCEFEDAEAHVIMWLTKAHFDKELMVVAAKEYQATIETAIIKIPEAAKREVGEPVLPKRIESAESPQCQLGRIVTDILQNTVDVTLIRTKDSDTELGVHLINNSLMYGAKRLIRLKKDSGCYNLQLILLEPSPSGRWKKAGLTDDVPIYDLAELYYHADEIRETAALFYA